MLSLNPTTQEDEWVMVLVAIWYRGRALPLAWATWAGNTPLEGDGFWKRVEAVLDEVASLLAAGVEVTLIADSAFGCATFIDLLVACGWHYVLCVQGQIICRNRIGRERAVESLVPQRAWSAGKNAWGGLQEGRLAFGQSDGFMGQTLQKTVMPSQ